MKPLPSSLKMMRQMFLIIFVFISLLSCKANKAEGIKVNSSDIQSQLRQIFTQKLSFREMDCPTVLVSPLLKKHPEFTQHCFVSPQEPEGLLKTMSQAMAPYSTVQIAWRQDLGVWMSTYDWEDGKNTVLVSFEAPSQSDELAQDPKLTGVGTVGAYLLGPK